MSSDEVFTDFLDKLTTTTTTVRRKSSGDRNVKISFVKQKKPGEDEHGVMFKSGTPKIIPNRLSSEDLMITVVYKTCRNIMAKTKVEYIVVVSILTFVSIVITLTSVSTQQWIYAEPESNIENATFTGYGYYGLFAGEWYIDEFEPQDIKIVCIVNENICGWSYEKNSKNQLNEIEQLYSKHPDRFLNAGLYIVTVCFIFISLIISGVTFVVSLLNVFTNPTNDWIGVYGLKILNIVTPCFYLLTLIMWAVEYQVYIIDNIAVKETIEGTMTTKDLTSLNYSYWIILIPMFLHVINIGVLYYRDYQINKQPTAPVMETDPQKDGIIFLY